jgi:hypothetical protein
MAGRLWEISLKTYPDDPPGSSVKRMSEAKMYPENISFADN